MELSSWGALLSPLGQEALRAAEVLAPREEDFLAHFQALSRQYPEDLARDALELAILRREAGAKFPFADKMYFTREALEQASSWQVASYRANRYSNFERLVDLGCSIGADSLALAGEAPTLGIDIDPLRLHMAQANARAMGLSDAFKFAQADLLDPLPIKYTPTSTGLFFDPARRAGGRRAYSVRNYHPPLNVIKTWLPDYPALGVKISPGVNLAELSAYQAEVEFISLDGDLKEAVLWFGPLRTAERRATLLPEAASLTPVAEAPLSLSEPRAYLYEPDPAVLRAGLVRTLAVELDAYQLDPDIAYLTGDDLISTPFARAWVVEDWFPFGLKRLRAYLQERGVGRVTVKKRGSPLEPERLIRDLRLKGEGEKVVFLSHLRGRPIVIVGVEV